MNLPYSIVVTIPCREVVYGWIGGEQHPSKLIPVTPHLIVDIRAIAVTNREWDEPTSHLFMLLATSACQLPLLSQRHDSRRQTSREYDEFILNTLLSR